MSWLKERLSEKSTYNGLATALLGIGVLTKMDEAPQIAGAIERAADSFSVGDYATGAGIVLMGVLSIFMKERGSK